MRKPIITGLVFLAFAFLLNACGDDYSSEVHEVDVHATVDKACMNAYSMPRDVQWNRQISDLSYALLEICDSVTSALNNAGNDYYGYYSYSYKTGQCMEARYNQEDNTVEVKLLSEGEKYMIRLYVRDNHVVYEGSSDWRSFSFYLSRCTCIDFAGYYFYAEKSRAN